LARSFHNLLFFFDARFLPQPARKPGAEKQLFDEEPDDPDDIASGRVNTRTFDSFCLWIFHTLNKWLCTSLISVPIVSVRGLVKEGVNLTCSRLTRVDRAGRETKRRLRVRWRGDDIAISPSRIGTVRQVQRVPAEHHEVER